MNQSVNFSSKLDPALLPDIDELEKIDPVLADTMALTFNNEAKTAISETLSAHKAGKTRPATDFFKSY